MATERELEKRESDLEAQIKDRRPEVDDLARDLTDRRRERARLKDLRDKKAIDPATGSVPSIARLAKHTVGVNLVRERLVKQERKLTRDEKKLDAVRVALKKFDLDEYQLWAQKALRHKNTIFAFSSPTGGTARRALEQQLAGQPITIAARNWNGSPVTGRYEWGRNERRIPIEMLKFIVECADRGRFYVNCIANAKHKWDSDHYWLVALDGDKSSAALVLQWAVNRISSFFGRALNEDRFHWHYWWDRFRSLVKR